MIRSLCLLAITVALTTPAPAETLDVWIGTDGGNGSKGIYHATLDSQSGRLSPSELAAEMAGPGFLALHPSGEVMYAVGGVDGVASVAAFAVVTSTTAAGEQKKTLEPINHVAVGDSGPCHVSVDSDGKMLLTAQYGGGSVAAFQLADDGSIIDRTQLVKQGPGSRVVSGRQEAAHSHWTGFSPDGRFAFVPDLGMDRIVIYAVDHDSATLTPHGAGVAIPGGGPRHMKFGPGGKQIYVLNELDLSVTVFDYDADAGSMTAVQTIATVPKPELAKEQFTSASEIRVHPSGPFVYSANRGHDTITAFKISQPDGQLSVIELEPIRGATPRNFNLDPAGKWLLAAGQDSGTLSVFAIDPSSGELTYNRSVLNTPAPICVLIEQR